MMEPGTLHLLFGLGVLAFYPSARKQLNLDKLLPAIPQPHQSCSSSFHRTSNKLLRTLDPGGGMLTDTRIRHILKAEQPLMVLVPISIAP